MTRRKNAHKRDKANHLRVGKIILPLLLISATLIFLALNFNSSKKMLEEEEPRYKEQEADLLLADIDTSELNEINVLLIGTDRRGDENGLSDTLMMANFKPESNELKLVSFMRDIYVSIPNYGMQKINAAHAFGGPDLVSETIYENFGIQTDYYASVDFTGFPKIFDLIIPKGIEVDIPYEMSHGIGMTLEPGEQTLHGDQLLGYVRFRHDKKSDFGRVERQQEVLTAAKKQGVNFQTLLNLPKILDALDTYVDTDIDKRILLAIGKSLIQEGSGEMESLRIPAVNAFTEERRNVGEVLVPDLEANKEALNQFLAEELAVTNKQNLTAE